MTLQGALVVKTPEECVMWLFVKTKEGVKQVMKAMQQDMQI